VKERKKRTHYQMARGGNAWLSGHLSAEREEKGEIPAKEKERRDRPLEREKPRRRRYKRPRPSPIFEQGGIEKRSIGLVPGQQKKDNLSSIPGRKERPISARHSECFMVLSGEKKGKKRSLPTKNLRKKIR